MVLLLLTLSAKVNLKNKFGDTALSLAIRNDHWTIVQVLMENGGLIDSLIEMENAALPSQTEFLDNQEAVQKFEQDRTTAEINEREQSRDSEQIVS